MVVEMAKEEENLVRFIVTHGRSRTSVLIRYPCTVAFAPWMHRIVFEHSVGNVGALVRGLAQCLPWRE